MVFHQTATAITPLPYHICGLKHGMPPSYVVHYIHEWKKSSVFPAGKGLKQGDPLSLLLFVLTMEYFSRQMSPLCTQRQFAYHPGCGPLQFTHLMFADDVLLFSKAHPPTLRGIMQVLRDFQLCTGLQANQAKSQAIYGGCIETLIEACRQITGFSTGTLPLRYLGVPLTSNRLTKIESRALVDKITRKVQLWSSRSLSFTGRAQLIDVVLSGMFTYWGSIFILPQ